MGSALKLTDQRSGRLVAKEPTKRRNPHGQVLWRCLCDCGQTCFVSATTIRRNDTLSCGCLQDEARAQRRPPGRRTKDLAKQTIRGKYVIQVLPRRHPTGMFFWLVRCLACKGELAQTTQQVVRGKSCGCLRGGVGQQRKRACALCHHPGHSLPRCALFADRQEQVARMLAKGWGLLRTARALEVGVWAVRALRR